MDPISIILFLMVFIALYYIYTLAKKETLGEKAGETVANLNVASLTPVYTPAVSADTCTGVTAQRITSSGLPDKYEIDFKYTPTTIAAGAVATLSTTIVPVSGFNPAKLLSWSASGNTATTASTSGTTVHSYDLVTASAGNAVTFSFLATANVPHTIRLRLTCAI